VASDQDNSEAASRNPRGRPRLLPDLMFDVIRRSFGTRARTRRQQQEYVWAYAALAAIREDAPGFPPGSPYAWIVCTDPVVQKTSVLAELGRLGDPEAIRQLARRVCELRQPAKRAVGYVRYLRRGFGSRGDRAGLRRHLDRALEDYLNAHPDTDVEDVQAVLDALAEEHERRTGG
jgi:hypothetical protein